MIAKKGKVFFIQLRPGKNGEIFSLVKFRTMNDRRDTDGHLLPDAERLTAIGRLIRKVSVDELPQLFNVLNGDMSLIGPRPRARVSAAHRSCREGRRESIWR